MSVRADVSAAGRQLVDLHRRPNRGWRERPAEPEQETAKNQGTTPDQSENPSEREALKFRLWPMAHKRDRS